LESTINPWPRKVIGRPWPKGASGNPKGRPVEIPTDLRASARETNSRKSQRQNRLGFPILVDKGGVVAAQLGLRRNVPDYLREIHKRVGADLTQFNGEDSWTLPMPVRYVDRPGREGCLC
jgi:hypothetical protein